MLLISAVSLAVLCILKGSDAHSYSLGVCPIVEPQRDFEMRGMLGLWHVIQKTSTGSSCITYNFTKTTEPHVYELEQVSQHFALGLTPLHHEYHYTGKLTVPDDAVPAKMTVKFPLSVGGTASYTIFATDYKNFAAIFTCQKLGFAHRQSATILSRERTLDKQYVDKIRSKLISYNIDPFDLSIISQKNCPTINGTGVNIGIDDETFSAQNIAGVIRKAGDKIGDGVEYVAGGAKKIYHKYSDKSVEQSDRNAKFDSPQAEWIP
ncbi:PREDICTED: apolipoprotein D-like [Nicrophorus vespilloides]|uniref:Apolipoprotein D n=1 Tax=Nicrophorus vespilloides TaxID=110193 RepID=A0ABM1N3C9_NICVS|nr:PREDICTED: apolipoprotein D-like [Nicrophorus vespilloides]